MFTWDGVKEQAAALLATGDYSVNEIATRTGASDRSIFSWKNEPEFAQRVKDNTEEIRQRILSTSIADRVQRVKRLDRRWKQIDQVVQERGEDPEMQNVPGGQSGLLCKDIKSVGGGENASLVDVYKFDAALVKEERELAKQAAQELGQWTEKHEHDFGTLSDAELIARAKTVLSGALETGDKSESG